MEKIAFVSQKHGRKTRHGTLTMIGGISFAIVPVKADRTVYFGIPGAHEDFLHVYAEPWDGDKESLESTIAAATGKLENTKPIDWVDTFSARTLEKVRAKELKCHREYIEALLEAHKAFNGKEWK